MRGICRKCEHGKRKTRDSCYCVKYGITIGYSKVSCDGYKEEKNEQIQCDKNRTGRNNF